MNKFKSSFLSLISLIFVTTSFQLFAGGGIVQTVDSDEPIIIIEDSASEPIIETESMDNSVDYSSSTNNSSNTLNSNSNTNSSSSTNASNSMTDSNQVSSEPEPETAVEAMVNSEDPHKLDPKDAASGMKRSKHKGVYDDKKDPVWDSQSDPVISPLWLKLNQ